MFVTLILQRTGVTLRNTGVQRFGSLLTECILLNYKHTKLRQAIQEVQICIKLYQIQWTRGASYSFSCRTKGCLQASCWQSCNCFRACPCRCYSGSASITCMNTNWPQLFCRPQRHFWFIRETRLIPEPCITTTKCISNTLGQTWLVREVALSKLQAYRSYPQQNRRNG